MTPTHPWSDLATDLSPPRGKLYTHASLMFTNDCVGELQYEGVTSAIVMAGIFLSFMVEYVGQRLVSAKVRSESALTPGERASTFLTSDMVAILVMELGILFHSLRMNPPPLIISSDFASLANMTPQSLA